MIHRRDQPTASFGLWLRLACTVPLEQAKLELIPRTCCGQRRSWAERKRVVAHYIRVVYGDSAFWRLLIISLIVALGTRATFRHLDATFPKYFMRTFGADAPFEVFVAVEPIITVLLSFPITFLLLRTRASTYASLVGGTLLQSFCPLALLWSSYGNTLGFVIIMALGEAIWSPKLYEYSTMVAPEGYEGTFVAVAFVPQYVSAGIVGVTSGYLLDRYVPSDEDLAPGAQRQPHMLWGMIAAASFVTPMMLACLKRRLFHGEPEALPPDTTRPPDTASDTRRAGARTGGGGGGGGAGRKSRAGGGAYALGAAAEDGDGNDEDEDEDDDGGDGGGGSDEENGVSGGEGRPAGKLPARTAPARSGKRRLGQRGLKRRSSEVAILRDTDADDVEQC